MNRQLSEIGTIPVTTSIIESLYPELKSANKKVTWLEKQEVIIRLKRGLYVPVLHENYDGQNLVFDEGGRVLDTVLFPHLKNLKGRTLITSDGTTILGADDKAGIAEIMTMAEYVLRSDVPHGKICLAFTPDDAKKTQVLEDFD